MNTGKLIACLALVSGFAPSAFANDNGFYVGAGIGTTQYAKNVTLDTEETLPMKGRSDKRGTSWNLTLGYQIGSHLAFELGYLDLGDARSSVADLSGESDAAGRFNFSVTGVTAALVGRFPIGKWTPYIRAGVLLSNTELDYSGSVSGAPFRGRVKGDSKDALFGAGVTFDLGSRWAAQLDITQVLEAGEPGSGQMDFAIGTLGIIRRF